MVPDLAIETEQPAEHRLRRSRASVDGGWTLIFMSCYSFTLVNIKTSV